MRLTWRATEVPSSFLSITPAAIRASPKRRLRSPFMSAETRVNSSSVMRPRARSASPRRSFFRLLAAKTRRPWSKDAILTSLPGADLEVAAPPLDGEPAEGLGDGGRWRGR